MYTILYKINMKQFRKPITKLGRCYLCKKPVSKRVSHTIFGDRPMWVSTNIGIFHRSCYELHKKSLPTKTEATATFEISPFKLEIKRGKEEIKPEEEKKEQKEKEGEEKK